MFSHLFLFLSLLCESFLCSPHKFRSFYAVSVFSLCVYFILDGLTDCQSFDCHLQCWESHFCISSSYFSSEFEIYFYSSLLDPLLKCSTGIRLNLNSLPAPAPPIKVCFSHTVLFVLVNSSITIHSVPMLEILGHLDISVHLHYPRPITSASKFDHRCVSFPTSHWHYPFLKLPLGPLQWLPVFLNLYVLSPLIH